MAQHFKAYTAPCQHGLTTGHSATTKLVDFSHFAIDTHEGGHHIDAINTDLAKAFYLVGHSALIGKFENDRLICSITSGDPFLSGIKILGVFMTGDLFFFM